MSAPPPEVSVVMGVRDGAADLPATVASVLEQEGVELELVVVDDGSADGTPDVLAALAAADPRVRLFRQEAAGLTAALIRGCAEARAPLIARQDCGDRSLPGRLAAQAAALERFPRVALVSCWTECRAPRGEYLYEIRGAAPPDRPVPLFDGARRRGRHVGPTSHGSVMFRRAAFEKAGGYRREFYMGQDWDLWFRLSECGEYFTVGRLLYCRGLAPGSLSLRYPRLQREFGKLSLKAAESRRTGLSDAPFLVQAAALSGGLSSRVPGEARARHEGDGYYHLGEALRRNGNPEALHYLRESMRLSPLRPRVWVRLAMARLSLLGRSGDRRENSR